jgi:two-component system, OmpR family, response regulator
LRTVTLSVTVTGPEEALNRLANSLSGSNSTIAWEVARPAETPTSAEASVTIDTRSHVVLVDGAEMVTTKREYELLLFFAEHQGAAFTRLQLLQAVWGHEQSGERTVDVHIRRLRLKLGKHSESLATVRGYGYRMTLGTICVL